jgi:hypothetical protein
MPSINTRTRVASPSCSGDVIFPKYFFNDASSVDDGVIAISSIVRTHSFSLSSLNDPSFIFKYSNTSSKIPGSNCVNVTDVFLKSSAIAEEFLFFAILCNR